jgi:hypothetical protein
MMKSMGWRFTVLADLGSAEKRPVRVGPGTPEGWLKPLGLEFTDERSFQPEALKAGAGGVDARLHDPAFQTVESGVRGLKFLLDHAGETVQIDVLSTPLKEAVARFREAVVEPELREFREPPISLVIADFDFSHQGADLATLSELAGLARSLQAPLVAGASPGFFGLKQMNLLPKLQDIPQRLADGAHAAWQKFQKQEAARWVVLTINRFLQRPVYPTEKVDPAKAEEYLWGRGGWLVAAAIARSVREHGHALDISGARAGGFAGMATRPFPKLANQTVPLTTEVELPDQGVLELSRSGFLPISGKTGSDTLILPLAINTFRNAPGRLTVSGTLGYQLMAARLAQFSNLLLDEIPPAAGEAVGFLKRSILDFLGTLSGKDPAAAVQVTPVDLPGGEGKPRPGAEIVVRPDVRIEGMEFQFVFQLPLRAS